MGKEIKYIGFYDLPNGNRVSNIAATSKMDYISEAINRAGYAVHLVSPSWLNDHDKRERFVKGSTVLINDKKRITYCPTFSTKNKITRNFKIVVTLFWLFFWIVKNVKREEKVLMYHVPWFSIPIRWSKKIIKFKLILEVEEIYGDVSVIHPYFYKLEDKLIESADAYLFSTDLLSERIGKEKPFIVLYGSYNTYPTMAKPPKDGKIHLLYAGIIDTHKAGAFNAVEAAKHLPRTYVLHIIGFGQIELLKQKIDEVNGLNGCQVFYDGIFSGNDYVQFCQKCHIGLSTQKVEGKYLESSFPSKILSYLGMGLNVISGNIDCVSTSQVSSLVNYYNGSSIDIAETIVKIELKSPEYLKEQIQELDIQFLKNVLKLIEN